MKYGISVITTGLSLIVIFGGLRSLGHPNKSPGKIIAREEVIVWKSPPISPIVKDRSPVTSRFQLTNTGGSPVKILAVECGGGCTKPRVEPEIIDPGATAEVITEATPFLIGEKQASIQLQTDSPETPSIRLALRMIGSSKPPFMIGVVGDLNYPNVEATREPREIIVKTVETSEMRERPKLTCENELITFEYLTTAENPYTSPDTIQRSYSFRPVFPRSFGEKCVATEVRVEDPWIPGHVEVLKLIVNVTSPIQKMPEAVIVPPAEGKGPGATTEFLAFIKVGP